MTSVAEKQEDLGAGLWLAALLIAVAVLVAYGNSYRGEFIYDDLKGLVNNSEAHGFTGVDAILADRELGIRRPLLLLTLQANYAWGELDPFGYHVLNVLIHLAAALALFGVVRRSLLTWRLVERFGEASTWLAAGCALIWATHPLQTESVTYVIQRGESLAGLFYLLTLYCVIRGAQSGNSTLWYTASIMALATGTLCKEIIITAPAVVLIYDRVFLGRSLREVFRVRWGLYLGYLFCWLLLVLILTMSIAEPEVGLSPDTKLSPLEYATTQPGVILRYLQLTILPIDLCLDYTWRKAHGFYEIGIPSVIVGSLVIATLLALYYRPALGFLGVWFFVILSPTSSVVPIQDSAVEHRMYLSLAAIAVLFVVPLYAAVEWIFRNEADSNFAVIAVCGSVVLLAAFMLSVLTWQRNEDYRTAIGMWTDVVDKVNWNPRAHFNLGMLYYQQQGDSVRATEHLRYAVELAPWFVRARSSLGSIYTAEGEYQLAEEQLTEALRIAPKRATAVANLGYLRLEQGRLEEAKSLLKQAIELEPTLVEPHNLLGVVYVKEGDYPQAMAYWQKTLELNPNFTTARTNLETLQRAMQASGSDSDEGP